MPEKDTPQFKEAYLQETGSFTRTLEGYMKRYLKDTLRSPKGMEGLPFNVVSQIERYVESEEPQTPGQAEHTRSLYQTVRRIQGKVPLLFFPPEEEKLKVQTQFNSSRNFGELISINLCKEDIELRLMETPIFTYTPAHDMCTPQTTVIYQPDLKGQMYFNKTFFHAYDLPKKGKSAMRNIAKTFFQLNNRPHVLLVQYMGAHTSSNEHYHKLDEWIVQVAGTSISQLRSIEQDTRVVTKQLFPGDILYVPANHQHVLFTQEKGSLTIPIKQTNPRRSDHYYQERSIERIFGELKNIGLMHHESGREIQGELQEYYSSLNNQEKIRLKTVLREKNFGSKEQIFASFLQTI